MNKSKTLLIFWLIIIAVVTIYFSFVKKSELTTPQPLTDQYIPSIGRSYESGDYYESLIVDGYTRTYFFHIPKEFDKKKQYPLVFGFHGGGGTGEKFASQTKMKEKANEEGFIAVFPNGIGHNWNDGRNTTDAFKQGADDIKFIRELVKNFNGKLPIDPYRIYATGVSNGGMFSQRLGCEMSDVFAAIGPVVGPIATLFVTHCNPSTPIAVVGIQGTTDPIIPIDGGKLGNLGDGGFVESADATMRLWVQKNECSNTPVISELFPEIDDGTRVKKYIYSLCRNDTEIYYYIVEGMGHNWPPKLQQLSRFTGPTSQNINATDIIWDFFKNHRKPKIERR